LIVVVSLALSFVGTGFEKSGVSAGNVLRFTRLVRCGINVSFQNEARTLERPRVAFAWKANPDVLSFSGVVAV
jgi:hypothetical protein